MSVSPSVERVLGWAPEQVVVTNVGSLIHTTEEGANSMLRAQLLAAPTCRLSNVESGALTAQGDVLSRSRLPLLPRTTPDQITPLLHHPYP